ncbi:MAG: hypothetical protein ABEI75_00210 [Halobaculum sp.]
MRRRTVLRRVGAATVGSAALSGVVAADATGGVTAREVAADSTGRIARLAETVGLETELDVSGVAGEVSLASLTDGPEALTDGTITVAPDADVITLGDCCVYCCDDGSASCSDSCDCCTCDTTLCL